VPSLFCVRFFALFYVPLLCTALRTLFCAVLHTLLALLLFSLLSLLSLLLFALLLFALLALFCPRCLRCFICAVFATCATCATCAVYAALRRPIVAKECFDLVPIVQDLDMTEAENRFREALAKVSYEQRSKKQTAV
jgi:ABC-type transport system involved in cytochrome bd biosynthesis fused ATPase/permease subunit